MQVFGVTANALLLWDDYIAAITSKSLKRLSFLKKIKQAGDTRDDLLQYGSNLWHVQALQNNRENA